MNLLNSLFSLTLSVSDRDTPDFKRVIENVVRSGCIRSSMDPDLGQIGVYRTETLSHLFELALYISSKDRIRAELTYAKLLQTAKVPVSKYVDDDISTIYGEDDDDSCADMPPLVPLTEPVVAPIELRISEIKGNASVGGLFDEITKPATEPVVSVEEDDDELVEEDEVAEEEEEEEQEQEEEVAEEEKEADIMAKEDEVAEEEEEVLELDLEPVRIKKTIYWKDVNSGDIYEMLPEDEVGDIVGKYVDGKPIFGPGL